MNNEDFVNNVHRIGETTDGEAVHMFDPRIPDILKPEDVYSIQVGDTMFRLSGASLSSDAPSYFTNFFKPFRDEPEESRPVLYIDRSADVFRLICRHLQGYHVVPEDESMYAYLFADASYYSLPRLQKLLSTSEILLRIGCVRFRLTRAIFQSPGNTPNFFTLGFAMFFGTRHDEHFHERLIRPLPLWPAEVPGRSPELFQHLVDLFQGNESIDHMSRSLKASLINECRFYRFRGLEQKLISHSISVNQERGGLEEITLLLLDLRESGLSIARTPLGEKAVFYERPYVDSKARDLVFQIEDEDSYISTSDMVSWTGSIIGKAGDKLMSIVKSAALSEELGEFLPAVFSVDMENAFLTVNGENCHDNIEQLFNKLDLANSRRKRKQGPDSFDTIYFEKSQWRFVFPGDGEAPSLRLLNGRGHTNGKGRNKMRKFLD